MEKVHIQLIVSMIFKYKVKLPWQNFISYKTKQTESKKNYINTKLSKKIYKLKGEQQNINICLSPLQEFLILNEYEEQCNNKTSDEYKIIRFLTNKIAKLHTDLSVDELYREI